MNTQLNQLELALLAALVAAELGYGPERTYRVVVQFLSTVR